MSDKRPRGQGRGYIAVGLSLCASGLIGQLFTMGMELSESSGRVALTTMFGVPIGIVVAIIGLVMVLREPPR